MLGANVGFVWPPHVQQCPTMLAFVGINVGIVWPGLNEKRDKENFQVTNSIKNKSYYSFYNFDNNS